MGSVNRAIPAPEKFALRRAAGNSVLAGMTLFLAGFLAGCNLFSSSSPPLVPKSEPLRPEIDAFTGDSIRMYTWNETLLRGDTELPLAETGVQVARTGDTLVGETLVPRLLFQFDAGQAPIAAATRLGFNPSRIAFDTAQMPEPGPILPFPEFPEAGWRFDTTIGELRFVRALRGIETLKQAGARHECWAFAESTYWNDGLIAAGVSWMGARGLVRHDTEWTGFAPSGAAAGPVGVLRREIRAL